MDKRREWSILLVSMITINATCAQFDLIAVIHRRFDYFFRMFVRCIVFAILLWFLLVLTSPNREYIGATCDISARDEITRWTAMPVAAILNILMATRSVTDTTFAFVLRSHCDYISWVSLNSSDSSDVCILAHFKCAWGTNFVFNYTRRCSRAQTVNRKLSDSHNWRVLRCQLIIAN